MRSRIGKIDYRFVPENTEGKESWIKEGEELDCENVAGAVSEALLEIDMTYYYFQANGEGGEPSYGDCLLRLKKSGPTAHTRAGITATPTTAPRRAPKVSRDSLSSLWKTSP